MTVAVNENQRVGEGDMVTISLTAAEGDVVSISLTAAPLRVNFFFLLWLPLFSCFIVLKMHMCATNEQDNQNHSSFFIIELKSA